MLARITLAGIAAIACLVLAFGTAATAVAADRWIRIAAQDIDLTKGSDTIDLTAARGKYKALRIYARRQRIFLDNVRVVYGLGRYHDEDRGITLKPGERTRPINQTAKGRFIDRIDLTYSRRNNARRSARLIVWGLQNSRDARAVRLRDKVKQTIANIKDNLSGGDSPVPDPVIETDSGTVFFGLKTVNFTVDRDIIEVGRKIGKFDKIRLRVKGSDIYINQIKVVYGNNSADVVAYEGDVTAGNRTRWLKLKGDRFIKHIELNYRSKPGFGGRARVEVYGEYAEDWLASGGKGKGYNRGWVYLGGQSPLFFSVRKGLGYEKDVVEVGRNKGGFRKIRVNVRNRAITLREMEIVYGDGKMDLIPVKKKISAGEGYGPVALLGDGKRVIQEIRVRYRSRIFDLKAQGQSYAFVEFWGKH